MFTKITQEEREEIMMQNDRLKMGEKGGQGGLFLFKTTSLEKLEEIFETRINGRCVTVGYENGNVRIPITYNNIEMVSFKNGECLFCEEGFPDTPYSLAFNSKEVQNIKFDDYSRFLEHTGGQAFIYFKNGDCLDITADF